MANRIFRGDAVPIAQVVKITPVNPEVGDRFTIKINGKEVTFVASDNLVSTMVEGLVNSWNSAAFPEANFAGADLSNVLMDKVDFSGADFTNAVLAGSIASGSSFIGATVTNADFSDALIDRLDQRSLCRDAEGTNPTTGVNTRASLGC